MLCLYDLHTQISITAACSDHPLRLLAAAIHVSAVMCRLAAQLARTEEAAKRALIRADQGVKGSTAQQLLDAQRQIQQLQAENSELSSKLAK